jgi:AcrR family transcriptional regulator
LTAHIDQAHDLNMFKTAAPTEKGGQTRNTILESALQLFREKGFEATTMRDVAAQACVALGAAYYYFPSKEAIIQSYYEVVQAEHNRRVAEALASRKMDLKQRMLLVMHSKLDIVQNDRKLLGVVFRYSGEPDHPLSCLGSATEQTRRESIEVFSLAIGEERLPKDLQQLLPIALWALQMGVLILFIYDDSPNQKRTRKLVDGALDLTGRFLSLAKNPLLKPIRTKVLSLLRETELLPDFQFIAAQVENTMNTLE